MKHVYRVEWILPKDMPTPFGDGTPTFLASDKKVADGIEKFIRAILTEDGNKVMSFNKVKMDVLEAQDAADLLVNSFSKLRP